MLVLSRKKSEVIKIGKDIEITVVSISGNRVKLGIEAPEDTKILRKELEESSVLDFNDKSNPTDTIVSKTDDTNDSEGIEQSIEDSFSTSSNEDSEPSSELSSEEIFLDLEDASNLN